MIDIDEDVLYCEECEAEIDEDDCELAGEDTTLCCDCAEAYDAEMKTLEQVGWDELQSGDDVVSDFELHEPISEQLFSNEEIDEIERAYDNKE